MSLWQALRQSGELRALDDALANSLRRLDPATPDTVLAGAALASLAVSLGHAGLELAQPRRVLDVDLPWPEAEAWSQALAASGFVATPTDAEAEASAAPLVLEHGLLYLRRYREYERRLARRLRGIAAGTVEGGIDGVAALFARLFPEARRGDAQARAAALALRRTLVLVTGGPGTGKTTTIARLLVLRIAQARAAGCSAPRIALAAPTGRAADRMAESLQHAVAAMAALEIEADLLAALPSAASTVHRLLGSLPATPSFRHHAEHPLPFDLVVVDEASMLDLPLMCKLAEAVASDAQLVLLGDADQLPSVEAGDVLAAMLQAAGAGDHLSEPDALALGPLLGEDASTTVGGAFGGHRVRLQRAWRQDEALQLAPLATAVREGDARGVMALLREGRLSNLHFHEGVEDPLQAQPELLDHWRRLATHTDPALGLREANRLRLLTALREGAQGARGLNARIEAALCGARLGATPMWFPGRLVLIAENSYRHGLFNGDVGLCLPDEQHAPLVWFPGHGGTRAFHPGALPALESAFALTVHKAQGSEFDQVWLQLPRNDARVLSRELLYTGLSRARRVLHLAGRAEVIAAALARHASRVSGLCWRLSDR